jgi:hypothetical protein
MSVVRPFERSERVVVSPNEISRAGQQFQIRGSEGLYPFGGREELESIAPGSSAVSFVRSSKMVAHDAASLPHPGRTPCMARPLDVSRRCGRTDTL